MGFFTDTSVCIGCKACEVACKEWNARPRGRPRLDRACRYDNTGGLGADTWRHVAFIEQPRAGRTRACQRRRRAAVRRAGRRGGGLPLADVLGRLQALHPRRLPRRLPHRRALPHRVRHRRRAGGHLQRLRLLRARLPVRRDRQAQGRRAGFKCTLCYDRLGDGQEPACAKACPTESIQFGELDELRERADGRVEQLHEAGVAEARLYGDDPERRRRRRTARSSCCSTSPRSTACRPTRS